MKILIRGTNWIGDSMMSVPAMREVRRIFPDSHITLHTKSSSEGLFENASFIDDIISFKRNRWPAVDVYDNVTFLRDEGFDLAILFPNSFESALTVFLSRIPIRVGYNKDARGLMLTHPIAVPEWKNRRHEVFYYLNLVGELERRLLGRDSVSSATPDISIEISKERKRQALKLLAAAGADPEKKTVLLGVGSTNSNAKRWPTDRYAALADRLTTECGTNTVLIGSSGDSVVASEVASIATSPPINLVGSTSTAEAASIISVSDLLVSNDMGLAHVAPAVGTRSITIFRHDVPCAPCMLRECPIDHRCMTGISPAAVFDQAAIALTDPIMEIYETTGSVS
ncbi:MAG: lipopolysaccharide heptosyltransferase II [Acidobacteriota bacterium]